MPTYTWSTTDKNSDVSLSGGNLIATHAGATSQDEVVRGATSGGVNKYIEFVFGTLTVGSNNSGVGLANASASLSSYLGSDVNAVGWFANGYVQGPGVAGNLAPSYVAGDVLGIAILTSSIKLYKNGTLAFTFPTLPSGALFPAASLYRQNDAVTANFGATALSFLPSGNQSWDGTQPTLNIAAGSGTFALTGGAATMPPLYTWSAADKNSDVALSNGNLTATHASVTSQNEVVRGAASGSVNKYIEFVFGTLTVGSNNSGVGLANTSASLSSDLGSDGTTAIGWFADGYIQGPGVSGFLAPGYIAGDVLGVAILTSSIRVYKNGTLAFTFPTLPSGALFPAASLYRQNDAVTANFGATALVYLPSGGFQSWNGKQASSSNLAASSGTFTLTGRAAVFSGSNGDFLSSDFTADFLIGATGAGRGIYNLTGRPAGLKINLPLSRGTFSTAGRNAAMAIGEPLGRGAFALTGRNATLTSASKQLAAGVGTFSLTGRVASFQGGIPVATGAYTLSGGTAGLSNLRPYGLYTLTGRSATLSLGEAAGNGTFALTGNTAATRRGNGMSVGAGTFKLTGGQVSSPEDGDAGGFLRRLKSLIPRGWVLRTAPIFDAVLGGLADSLANFYALLNAVRNQTRIATATGWFLDLIGWDFLGANYLRKDKETDDHWRARIIREVLRPRATRLGIETALEDLTGRTPKIYEPWNATDDGGGYGAVGGRIAYGQSGYYGSVVLPAQVFVTAYKNGFSGIPNITGYGYGNGGYGVGKISYASLTQVEGEISDAEIFDCVHQNIAAGAKAWVAIGAAPIAVNNIPAGRGAFTLTGNAAALSHNVSAQLAQFLNRLITMPSASRQTAYATLISNLVAAGVWAKLDVLLVLAAADGATGLTNLVQEPHRGFLDLVTGTPVFTADRGWSGNGAVANKDVNTNFNPSTAAGNYTQNDAMFCAWQIGSTQENVSLVNDTLTDSKTELYPKWSDGNTYWGINGAEIASTAPSDASGFWLAQRTGAGACELHHNDTLVATSPATSAAMSNSSIVLNPLLNTAACVAIGGSLNSSQQTALYNAVHSYMIAVGAA